jgi:hypothetical protein
MDYTQFTFFLFGHSADACLSERSGFPFQQLTEWNIYCSRSKPIGKKSKSQKFRLGCNFQWLHICEKLDAASTKNEFSKLDQ